MARRYPPKLERTRVADAPQRLGTAYRAHNGVRADPGYATAEVNVVRDAATDRLCLQIYSAAPGTRVRVGYGRQAVDLVFGVRSATRQDVEIQQPPPEHNEPDPGGDLDVLDALIERLRDTGGPVGVSGARGLALRVRYLLTFPPSEDRSTKLALVRQQVEGALAQLDARRVGRP